MDGVEMVMLAEERFGVAITDDEAEKVRTPEMFIDLIFGKLKRHAVNHSGAFIYFDGRSSRFPNRIGTQFDSKLPSEILPRLMKSVDTGSGYGTK
ncbi:MAG TPA: hypothetical protein VK633_03980 [Verrucomicrobiae bacterium]|nr:hypothetical protein [Verrucomicrobiae bacterium]